MRTLTTKLLALLCTMLIGLYADAANIEISNAITLPFQEVTITVTIDDLPDRTTSIQGSLTWDDNAIMLVETSASVLPNMTFNEEEDDRLGFSWFDAAGVELSGANELMRLTFMATNEASGRVAIRFDNDPTNLEVAGAGPTFPSVPLETIDGYIDILEDLPVELAAFDAAAAQDAIALTWATESETNFEGFEVQRSIDGNDFSAIAWLDGRGSENQGSSYGYTDNSVTRNKTYYYRLQMWDFDGTFEYSNVESSRIAGRSPVIELFPNPAQHETMLVFESFTEMNAPVSITVNDNMGRLVHQVSYTAQTGKNTINLDVNHLPTGMYTIRLEQGDYFATRKLIVR